MVRRDKHLIRFPGQEDLFIEYSGGIKAVVIRLGDARVDNTAQVERFENGLEYTIPDGRRVRLWRNLGLKGFLEPEVSITVDGVLATGTGPDPHTRLKEARIGVCTLGLMMLLLGLAFAAHPRHEVSAALVLGTVYGGLLFAVGLALPTGSRAQARGAMNLFWIEALLSPAVGGFWVLQSLSVAGICMRLLVLHSLYRALLACNELHARRTSSRAGNAGQTA